jgi:hypothetical protein
MSRVSITLISRTTRAISTSSGIGYRSSFRPPAARECERCR